MRCPFLLWPLLAATILTTTGRAQTTAFTYQGRLSDGTNPASGIYDLVFLIYDAPTGPGIFANLFSYATAVSNGLFTVTLDFGAGMFSGADRWLEIGVRTNGGSSFTTLTPRQKFTATPYAITAGHVVSGGLAGGTYTNAVTFNNAANGFTGNGGGLTNVSALNLGGVGADGFWRASGNTSTTPGVNFLGTKDNQALEFRVNNARALLIEPTGGAASFVGGYSQNTASGPGAVVAGGGTSGSINEAAGMYAFVGAGHGSKAGPFGAVVGGAYNVSPGPFAFIGSGLANTNQGPGSVIVGGTNNLVAALADSAFIGGGQNNVVNNSHGTIGGGEANVASTFSTVGGGRANRGAAAYATVAGGRENQSAGTYSSAGGGYNNLSSGDHATVAGGFSNVSGSTDASVGGGSNNVIQLGSDGSAIGGGQINLIQANSIFATIAGGEQNSIGPNAGAATIAGGFVNTIESGAGSSSIAGGNGNRVQSGAIYSAITGGLNNTIGTNARAATIAGGNGNTIGASTSDAVISGGTLNRIENNTTHSAIGGGYFNLIQANASDAVIGGGRFNVIDTNSAFSAIGGGLHNWIESDASHAVIGGGEYNSISPNAFYSTIPGGYWNVAAGPFSFAAGRRAEALHQGAFVWADSQDADFASTANNQFSIRAAGGVRLNTDTSLFFGGQTRQMLNLWGTDYGIGVQPNTLYFRANDGDPADGFAWFKGGSHMNLTKAPGPDGVLLMSLDDSGLLLLRGGIRWSLGGALVDNQGGSIELGNSTASGATPFIDFHYGVGVDQDANVRLINDADQQLTIARAGSATPMARLNAAGLTVSGAIELGDSTASAATPYLDFHYGIGTAQDFNVRIANDGNGQLTIGRAGSAIAMAQFSPAGLTVNGAVVLTSDRNRKENFQPVDAGEVLAKVAALSLTRWNYKEDSRSTHIGPMAQDFHAAFGVGPDDKHIATVDADGVALAAIQGLNKKLEEKLQQQETEIATLKQAVRELQSLLKTGSAQESQ